MDRNAAFRLASFFALAVGLTGMGPGNCGPLPEPDFCDGLDEQTCLGVEGCAPVYFESLCACSPCADEYDCPPCDCGGAEFAGCEKERQQPLPEDRCAELDEGACYADPGCQPVYFGGEPGTRCEADGRCLGDYAGCVEAPRPPPPLPCEMLEERACHARPDCEPLYGPETQPACELDPTDPDEGCGYGGGFVECRPVGCEPVACLMHCPTGFAVDERGCEICACAPGCFEDGECAAGERCEIAEIDCPPGADCSRPLGRCVPVERTCSSDQECLPGESCVFPESYECPPETYCGMPLGTCQPTGPSPCAVDSDCARGEVCRADPNDPCSQPNVYCFAPAATVCLPACTLLDEPGCLSRPDCRGVWGSDCSDQGCTPDRAFQCEDATTVCSEVLCDLWCPNGFQRDAQGCEICACLPDDGCRSDADCAAGEYCEQDMTNCDPAGMCEPSAGVCRPSGCLADSDCPSGSTCLMMPSPCDEGDYCQSWGVCAPEGSCLSDADCAAGQSCMFLLYDCLGEGCEPGYGVCNGTEPGCASDADCAPGQVCEGIATCAGTDCPPPPPPMCVDRECTSDADCAAGSICRADPADPCSSPEVMCGVPARHICQAPCAALDESTCLARTDCSASYGQVDGWCGNEMGFIGCADL